MKTDTPAIIESGKAYGLAEAQERLRMGKAAWRSAQRDGLPVRRVGRRGYVLGDDVLAWLKTKPIDVTPRGAANPFPDLENLRDEPT